MTSTPLVFTQPWHSGGNPVPLVLGAGGQAEVPSYAITAQGRITGLRGQVRIASLLKLRAQGRITGLRGSVAVGWNVNVSRPTVGRTFSAFQKADAAEPIGVKRGWGASLHVHPTTGARYQSAKRSQDSHNSAWDESVHMRVLLGLTQEDAAKLRSDAAIAFEHGVRTQHSRNAGFEKAARRNDPPVAFRFQETYRTRRNLTAARFRDGSRYSKSSSEYGGAAQGLHFGRYAVAQDGIPPPIGIFTPVPPGHEPGYVPELPADLEFNQGQDGTGDLVFVPDRPSTPEPDAQVVVTVKEVYLTINSAVLIRVDSGHIIPALDMSMSLDVDSWTWSFSAAVSPHAESSVMPNSNGDPVVVQASINGTAFRFLVERVGRERTFNNTQIRINGRGIAAELDNPYAPSLSHRNSTMRTARQLLDDILTINGVGIGWDIDKFNVTDWDVPAGAFSHVGSYISALNAVVGSVGGYVQPHNTQKKLDIHLRYPSAPWKWGEVGPDYELPAAVTTQEGIEWHDKAIYNRVFVVGQEYGVLGQFTRTGTAGDLIAPTVVDPLITHVDAVRQRGRAVLSDTGRIAMVSLRLPVLAETGVIKPGKFVRYTEGGKSHIGISRSVSVDVQMPTIYQTIVVETHPHELV